MSRKQYAVIGLGRFGTSIASTLYELGHDVLAIDSNADRVQNMVDKVTHAVQADSTDENSLREIGIRNFDTAVVSIGEDIQSSIMTTLILRELGIKYIVAKANNAKHAKVLMKIGADRVIFPEKDMGVRVAHNLVSSNILDYIEFSPEYSIAEFLSPQEWHGKNLMEINVRSLYGINIVAIKRDDAIDVSPRAVNVIEPGDVIVAIGSVEDLRKLESII